MNSQESEKMDAVSKNAENNPAQENSSADEKNRYPAIPEDALIIIPVRNMVLFPGMVVPITNCTGKISCSRPGRHAR